jgi:pimeloyl-ACP methyl ester carboxylesterase
MTLVRGGQITTAGEMPLWLRSGPEDVFAIMAQPPEPNGTGVILLHSGTHSMTAAIGRIWVRVARELAADGAYVLRLDFAGSGDSSGLFERRGDGQPVADVAAGLDELVNRGAVRVVVVSQCYSAVPAMLLALDRPEVRRLVLLSPPLTWVTRGQTAIQAGGAAPLGDALRATFNSRTARLVVTDAEYRKWLVGRARRRMLRAAKAMSRENHPDGGAASEADRVLLGKEWIGSLAHDQVGICLMYGAQDRMYDDFVAARQDGLAEVLDHPCVEVVVEPVGSIHSLRDAGAQDLVAARVHAATRSLNEAGQ